MDPRAHRILHLEDDSADVERVQAILTNAGLRNEGRQVTTKDEFERAVGEFDPDVVPCDHALTHFDARCAIEYLRTVHRATPLIVVTGALTEQLVVEYIKAGAADFVSKANLGRLAPAIEAAVAARQEIQRLTPRQIDVLRLIAEGRSTTDIASKLSLSAKTVETHRLALMDRLGIHSIAGLIRFAIHVGLAPPAT